MALQAHSTALPVPRQNSPKKLVLVNTAEFKERIGTLEFICPSPYHGETVQLAFIVSLPGDPFWTEYVLVKDLRYANPSAALDVPERELEDDPEYIQFLYDCERSDMLLEMAD